jgi:hypothetical protein
MGFWHVETEGDKPGSFKAAVPAWNTFNIQNEPIRYPFDIAEWVYQQFFHDKLLNDKNLLFPPSSLHFFYNNKQTLKNNMTFFSTSHPTLPRKNLNGVVKVGQPSSSYTNVISWMEGHLTMLGHKCFGVGLKEPDAIMEEQQRAREKEELYSDGFPDVAYYGSDDSDHLDPERDMVTAEDGATSSAAAHAPIEIISDAEQSPAPLAPVAATLPSPTRSTKESAPATSRAPRAMSVGLRNSYLEVSEYEFSGEIGSVGKIGQETPLAERKLKYQIVEDGVRLGERGDNIWFSHKIRAGDQELTLLTHQVQDPVQIGTRIKLQAIVKTLWEDFLFSLDEALEALHKLREKDHQIPDIQILREFAGRVPVLSIVHFAD